MTKLEHVFEFIAHRGPAPVTPLGDFTGTRGRRLADAGPQDRASSRPARPAARPRGQHRKTGNTPRRGLAPFEAVFATVPAGLVAVAAALTRRRDAGASAPVRQPLAAACAVSVRVARRAPHAASRHRCGLRRSRHPRRRVGRGRPRGRARRPGPRPGTACRRGRDRPIPARRGAPRASGKSRAPAPGAGTVARPPGSMRPEPPNSTQPPGPHGNRPRPSRSAGSRGVGDGPPWNGHGRRRAPRTGTGSRRRGDADDRAPARTIRTK